MQTCMQCILCIDLKQLNIRLQERILIYINMENECKRSRAVGYCSVFRLISLLLGMNETQLGLRGGGGSRPSLMVTNPGTNQKQNQGQFLKYIQEFELSLFKNEMSCTWYFYPNLEQYYHYKSIVLFRVDRFTAESIALQVNTKSASKNTFQGEKNK